MSPEFTLPRLTFFLWLTSAILVFVYLYGSDSYGNLRKEYEDEKWLERCPPTNCTGKNDDTTTIELYPHVPAYLSDVVGSPLALTVKNTGSNSLENVGIRIRVYPLDRARLNSVDSQLWLDNRLQDNISFETIPSGGQVSVIFLTHVIGGKSGEKYNVEFYLGDELIEEATRISTFSRPTVLKLWVQENLLFPPAGNIVLLGVSLLFVVLGEIGYFLQQDRHALTLGFHIAMLFLISLMWCCIESIVELGSHIIFAGLISIGCYLVGWFIGDKVPAKHHNQPCAYKPTPTN